MRRHKLRSWKAVVLLAVGAAAITVWASGAGAASHARAVKLAIMTDCKGAFGFAYESDIGGAQAALAQYAHGVPKNKAKPSAGMTGIKVGSTPVNIVGYGCGNDTVPVAVTETKRLMEKLGADVLVGPLSGDEAVYVANYAKAHPTKTFVIGTAGSEDPTMQIHPKNLFRYHGDGAQWNAGIGEIAYKTLHWRKAAIIMDDYSFGWTSGAGMVLDFCAVGGNIVKRVFPPLNTTDYAPFVRQLPNPNQVDGYFSAVGGTGTSAMLKAFEQAYGSLDPKKWVGNLFFGFLGADKVIAPKFPGAYIGGTGTGPGLKTPQAKAYEAVIAKWYGAAKLNPADLFVANYYNAAWALVQGLTASGGQLGAKLNVGMPRKLKEGYAVSRGGYATLDSRNQAIQDQYQLQLVKNADGSFGPQVVAYVPAVDQSFGGLVKPTDKPYGRTVPACKKIVTPWQGKIKIMKNGAITNQVVK